MKKQLIGGSCTAVLLAASLFLNPCTSKAQDKPKPAPTVTAANTRPYPFSGRLESVNREKMTITLVGKEKPRTLHLTSDTKIEKAGQPATLADATAGDSVAGRVLKSPDGRETLVSLRIGAKPSKEEKPGNDRTE